MNKSLILKSAIALALAAPLLASAESNIVTGTATATPGARAKLNFKVTIPEFIALKVGSGTILTNGGTPDEVLFAVPDASATTDTAIAATSPVAVQLLSNVGSVAFSSSGADLSNGAGDTIPLSQITATSSGLVHPAFNAAAVTVNPVAGKVVNQTGSWTFSYAHEGATTPIGAGTFTTLVTYTAAKP